ncbi:MAG: 4-hydroxythreonine-4-phosphate dehydrogenase PdxA [Verrucomicrobiota bacterium]
MRKRIGITLGDVAGIGPEVIAKALASGKLDRRFDYEIIGNPATKRRRDAFDWIVAGVRRCLAGDLAALVTGPIAKELVAPWPGQTELLAHLCGTKKFAMLFASDKLRVALVTTHAPLREVPDLITGRKIGEVIALTRDFCRRIGIRRPRIAVTGLNPHAGEGGLLGTEERRIIAPAIKRARAIGPCPADTVFYRALHGEFDAVIAMYHDQGLAPFKLLAFDNGVNITIGLPFVRTSPDHGTAPDIAGQGIARPAGMIAAINLAAQLAAKR